MLLFLYCHLDTSKVPVFPKPRGNAPPPPVPEFSSPDIFWRWKWHAFSPNKRLSSSYGHRTAPTPPRSAPIDPPHRDRHVGTRVPFSLRTVNTELIDSSWTILVRKPPANSAIDPRRLSQVPLHPMAPTGRFSTIYAVEDTQLTHSLPRTTSPSS